VGFGEALPLHLHNLRNLCNLRIDQ